MSVEFVEPLADAFHQGLPLLLAQLALDSEHIIKLPSRAILQQQIHILLIVEEGVHLDQVHMREEGLYLQLPDELFKEVLAFDGFLLDDLDR